MKGKIIVLILLAGLITVRYAYAQPVTITTYYPAPYGEYVTLRTINDGERVDIGFDTGSPSIQLFDGDASDGEQPHIDFSNTSVPAIGYDAQIILWDDDTLWIDGAHLAIPGHNLAVQDFEARDIAGEDITAETITAETITADNIIFCP